LTHDWLYRFVFAAAHQVAVLGERCPELGESTVRKRTQEHLANDTHVIFEGNTRAIPYALQKEPAERIDVFMPRWEDRTGWQFVTGSSTRPCPSASR
jgi:hypothetical protein